MVLGERSDGGGPSDSGELADGAASELDAAGVWAFFGDRLDEVGIKVNPTSSARIVIQHDRKRAGRLHVEEKLLQGGLVDRAGEVSRGDDNDDIGADLSGRLAERDRRTGRVAAAGNISALIGPGALTFRR